MPNVVPEKPWTHITADFITKLLLAQKYDSILVVCDSVGRIASSEGKVVLEFSS